MEVPVSGRKGTADCLSMPMDKMMVSMSSPDVMDPIKMLPTVSGFGGSLEHTFLKLPTLPQQPHSFPFAGHSDRWWNDSALQF